MPVDEIEKDPDAFTGTCVHMWGYIVQWDANTGACSFRAELAGRYYQDWFEYDGNNYLAAGDLDSCPELDGIDNNDFIEFWATGAGALTYDTTIGGSATAALWAIEKIALLKKE